MTEFLKKGDFHTLMNDFQNKKFCVHILLFVFVNITGLTLVGVVGIFGVIANRRNNAEESAVYERLNVDVA